MVSAPRITFANASTVIALTVVGTVLSPSARAALQISSAPTANVTCTAGACSATARSAVLNVDDLAAMLADGDVSVESGSIAKDIQVKAALSWASTSRLTVDSYRSILFNRSLTVVGSGALTIKTNDGSLGGDFRFAPRAHIDFSDTHSSLIINGASYTLSDQFKNMATLMRRDGFGNFAMARNMRTRRTPYFQSPLSGFSGNLEGLGHTISNLSINAPTAGTDIGLIGEFNGGTIHDIGLLAVNIVASGNGQNVGGFVGNHSLGSLTNCYVTGQISSTGQSSLVGGFAGDVGFATIRNSWSDVNVSATGSGSSAGGLMGHYDSGSALAFISQSYASGPVTVGDSGIAGGIVGQNIAALIEDSYATGAVTGGNNAIIGGLVGTNANHVQETLSATITTSYSIGALSGGSGAMIGGLIGTDSSGTVSKRDYWDLDTSGVSDPSRGAGNIANDPGITGLTTEQFKSGLPKGFRPAVWTQDAGLNNGYPHLAAIPPRN